MKRIYLHLLMVTGLLLMSGGVQAVDCNAIKAKYNCPADRKLPLHLSFDDGPALQTTDVLDVLRHEKIQATFFSLAEKVDCEHILQECKKTDPSTAADGSQCIEYRQCQIRTTILKKAKQEGHMIGSHSYTHVRHSELNPALMNLYFRASKRVLAPYFTTEPPLFRLPYGDGWFNRNEKPHVMKALKDLNFLHVDWQFSAFDWDTKNQEGDKILDNVMTQVCSRPYGGLVLFHDGMDNKMHEGRLFTTSNIAKWLPAMRCAVDFKPLDHFLKGYTVK